MTQHENTTGTALQHTASTDILQQWCQTTKISHHFMMSWIMKLFWWFHGHPQCVPRL